MLVYANGRQYEGEFSFGLRNGSGIERDKTGVIYKGVWKKGLKHGEFLATLPHNFKSFYRQNAIVTHNGEQ